MISGTTIECGTIDDTRKQRLPLPKGEGRGEGKQCAAFQTVFKLPVEVLGDGDPNSNSSSAQTHALILGVGNLLMGDEGIGVAAIRHLEQKGFADRAELVDGGTGGFHLLGYFRDRRHIILIDAAADDRPIGAASLLQPRYASDFPPSLTAHDIGLKDLLESAALLGDLPHVDLITISIGGLGSLSMDLSPAVSTALPKIEELVRKCLH